MASLGSLGLSAFLIGIAFLLNILACTVVPQKNGWPLMSLILFCFTPVPFFLCGQNEAHDSFLSSGGAISIFNGMGLFLGGALLVSGPALAVVLFHVGVISAPALWLTLCAGACCLGAGFCISSAMGPQGEEEEDYEYDF